MKDRHVLSGGEVLRKATATLMIVVVSLATACASAAPTPTQTPEPTATPVWVLATKTEHLEGIWYSAYFAQVTGRGAYYRFEPEGTIYWAYTLEDLQQIPDVQARFWFEDGVYYEENNYCPPVGSYRIYLEIEGGQAVGLRFEVIDDRDPACNWRRYARDAQWTRVDR